MALNEFSKSRIRRACVHQSPENETPLFHPADSPSDEDIRNLVQILAARITRYLKRKGYLKEDDDVGAEGSDPLTKQSPLLAACVSASVQNKSALGDRAELRCRATC